jgi:Family of unknown function (DUF6544)
MRGLAELPWHPHAFRESAYLTWEAVGPNNLRASLDDGRTPPAVEFEVDAEGHDHRFIKKRIAASLWFRSVRGALNTIAEYESMHMIRKVKSAGWRKATSSRRSALSIQIYGIAA